MAWAYLFVTKVVDDLRIRYSYSSHAFFIHILLMPVGGQKAQLIIFGVTAPRTIPGLDVATTYYYSLTSYNTDNQALTISNGHFETSTTGTVIPLANHQIRIYPNPVPESFHISGIAENTWLVITDITGKI